LHHGYQRPDNNPELQYPDVAVDSQSIVNLIQIDEYPKPDGFCVRNWEAFASSFPTSWPMCNCLPQ